MKIIKIVLISLAVFLVLIIAAAAIFVATFDVNRYKPQIITQAKAALNRDIDFSKASLALSLAKGVSVRIYDVKVGDDPAMSKGTFLEVKDVSVGVDIFGLLFHRKLDVSYLYINSPSIKIIRQKDGALNLMTVGKPQPAGSAAAEKTASPALPVLLISSIKVGNGTLVYEDRSFEPALSLVVADLTVQVTGLSLSESFPFTAEGAVLSAGKNIRVEGSARLDISNNAVTISGLKASTDLSELQLEKIPVAFPMTKGMVLPSAVKGKVTLNLDTFKAGSKGLTDLNGDLALTAGILQFKEIASPVKDIELRSKLTLSKIAVDSVSGGIGEGTFKGSGNIENYLTTQNYDLSVSAENIKLQELVNQEKAAAKAEGILSGDLKVKGAGFSPEAVKSTLSGEGNVLGKSLVLKDINLLRMVLDKISLIPDLSQKVQNGLPDKYKDKLTQKDTVLSDVKMPVTVNNGSILFKDAKISSDEFIFEGEAQAGFDSSFSASGSFLIPRELSGAMAEEVPQLQYLLNPDKQIYVPLKVSGKAPQMSVSVDLEYLGKKLLVNQLQNQLIDIFNKAVGGEIKSEPSNQ